MSIGSRIKEARMRKGMTQEQLAKALHVTNGAVGNYESDATTPKRDILCSIMEVLECDANYLYQDLVNTTDELYVSPAEREHIKKYRALGDHGQHVVDTLLDIEYAWYMSTSTLPDHLDNGEVDEQIAQSERLHDLLDKSTRSGA